MKAIKDFNVFGLEGFFLFSTLLRVSRQDISNSISLALIIIDLEVVTREFLSLTNLFEAQTLCVYELSEIVIVGKHENFMQRAL